MTSHVTVKTVTNYMIAVTVITSHDKEKQWCYTIWLLYVCYQEISQKRNIVLAEMYYDLKLELRLHLGKVWERVKGNK